MREIKFRIWTGSEMILLENSGLQYYDFEGSFSLGFTVDGYTHFWAHEQYESMTKKVASYPIMEYTGLKDKNNNDIYEGDILTGGLVVVFHEGGFCFDNSNNSGADRLHSERVKRLEVIGNIHKTPELIQN